MAKTFDRNAYLLQMKNIEKSFPGVKALNGAGIDVKYGEVVALCGENGAGKSTLMKCLYGSYVRDSGEVLYEGKSINYTRPEEGKANGIIMVFQELSLATDLTVAENMFLGSQPKKGMVVDWAKMNADAQKALDALNSTVKATDLIRNLPIAQQQMVEIAKGVALGAKIMILDEPTSSLTEREKVNLFNTIKTMKSQGVGIIYISHKMDEIMEISDHVTVMRDGTRTGDFETKDTDLDSIIASMIGRTMTNYYSKCEATPGKEVLRVENLSSVGYFKDVSFSVHEREVVGFYGLVGAGRTEIMETIFGVRPKAGGKVFLNGKEMNAKSSVDAVKSGIGFVTENRKEQGLLLDKSCRENISLAKLPWITKGGLVDEAETHRIYDKYYNELKISSPSSEQEIVYLSGGNQQKVILGKWLCMEPTLLILDEPTRGIDIGAKAEIYNLIKDLAEKGMAVIIISSEMPEIMGISNRIYSISQGHLTGELTGDQITEENLMRSIVITDSSKGV